MAQEKSALRKEISQLHLQISEEKGAALAAKRVCEQLTEEKARACEELRALEEDHTKLKALSLPLTRPQQARDPERKPDDMD